jgi:ECF transporter S component (folate family)
MLLAVQLVLDLFTVYLSTTLRIEFGFLALSATGALLGPVPAMIQGALADILGVIIHPAGAYFPGFTITAILTGLISGLMLYRRKPDWRWALALRLTVNLLLNIALNTLWLSMMTGNAYLVLLLPRILKNLITTPIETLLWLGLWVLLARLWRGKENS